MASEPIIIALILFKRREKGKTGIWFYRFGTENYHGNVVLCLSHAVELVACCVVKRHSLNLFIILFSLLYNIIML